MARSQRGAQAGNCRAKARPCNHAHHSRAVPMVRDSGARCGGRYQLADVRRPRTSMTSTRSVAVDWRIALGFDRLLFRLVTDGSGDGRDADLPITLLELTGRALLLLLLRLAVRTLRRGH